MKRFWELEKVYVAAIAATILVGASHFSAQYAEGANGYFEWTRNTGAGNWEDGANWRKFGSTGAFTYPGNSNLSDHIRVYVQNGLANPAVIGAGTGTVPNANAPAGEDLNWFRIGFNPLNNNDGNTITADDGAVIQNAQTVNVNAMWMGSTNALGTYEMNGGTLNVANALTFGENDVAIAGQSVFTQNDGTVNLGRLRMSGSDGTEENQSALYNMHGGTLTVDTNFDMAYHHQGGATPGHGRTGIFNQTGGDVVSNATIQLGKYADQGGEAYYDLSGGSLTVNNDTPFDFFHDIDGIYVNLAGGGTLNLLDADADGWDFTQLTAIDNADFRVNGIAATEDDLIFTPIMISGDAFTQITVPLAAVPEPSSVALWIFVGLVACGGFAARRRGWGK